MAFAIIILPGGEQDGNYDAGPGTNGVKGKDKRILDPGGTPRRGDGGSNGHRE